MKSILLTLTLLFNLSVFAQCIQIDKDDTWFSINEDEFYLYVKIESYPNDLKEFAVNIYYPNDTIYQFFTPADIDQNGFIVLNDLPATGDTVDIIINDKYNTDCYNDDLRDCETPIGILAIEIESDSSLYLPYNTVKAYPNPFESSFTVDYKNEDEVLMQFKLIDVSGRTLEYIESDLETIRLTFNIPYPSGLYILFIIHPNSVTNIKMIKK